MRRLLTPLALAFLTSCAPASAAYGGYYAIASSPTASPQASGSGTFATLTTIFTGASAVFESGSVTASGAYTLCVNVAGPYTASYAVSATARGRAHCV